MMYPARESAREVYGHYAPAPARIQSKRVIITGPGENNFNSRVSMFGKNNKKSIKLERFFPELAQGC
jgi:hypothetical protein